MPASSKSGRKFFKTEKKGDSNFVVSSKITQIQWELEERPSAKDFVARRCPKYFILQRSMIYIDQQLLLSICNSPPDSNTLVLQTKNLLSKENL